MPEERIVIGLPRETMAALRQMAAARGLTLHQEIVARLTRSAEVFTEVSAEKEKP